MFIGMDIGMDGHWANFHYLITCLEQNFGRLKCGGGRGKGEAIEREMIGFLSWELLYIRYIRSLYIYYMNLNDMFC